MSPNGDEACYFLGMALLSAVEQSVSITWFSRKGDPQLSLFFKELYMQETRLINEACLQLYDEQG